MSIKKLIDKEVIKYFINKKRLAFTWIMGILIGITGLYATYAVNVYLEETTPTTYDMALDFELSSVLDMQVVVPAGKTKSFDIEITNPYNDAIKYGVAYSMVSPTTLPSGVTIAQNFSSEYATTGRLEANGTVSPALVVENTSTSDLTILFSVIGGYKNGGGLVVPSGKTLVTDTYVGGVTVVTDPSSAVEEGWLEYEYTTPGMTEVILEPGEYFLEAWGAQGGSYSTTYTGGLGGNAYGSIELTEETTVYVYVGGQPETNTTSRTVVTGGFNGGGNGYNRYYSGTYTYGQGGGGASDIRIGTDSLYARVLVAGGGSGSTNRTNGYYGGGSTSGTGLSGYEATRTTAGTNGSFGQGGSATTSGNNYKYGSAGGGGGWYGGGASSSYSDSTNYDTYSGGGSGWVYTETNAQYTASSYTGGTWLLSSDYYLTGAKTTGNGSTKFTDFNGSSVTGHAGNGAVRINKLIYIYSIPVITGLKDLDIAQGETIDLNEGVTITCATDDTECSISSISVQDTSSLPTGTYTIYYIARGGNGSKYAYPRNLTVYENPALKTLARLGLKDEVNNTVYTSFTGISTDADTGIFPSNDDLGTSYYFRGNVTNNYVRFGKYSGTTYRGYYDEEETDFEHYSTLAECENDNNDHCVSLEGENIYWRIVRINGDGTVRMIYDGTNPHENGVEHIDRYIEYADFSNYNDDNAFIGYMNGTIDGKKFPNGTINSISYDEAHSNNYNSEIKDLVDTWYETNIYNNGYSNYVADAIYCNDRSLLLGRGFGEEDTDYSGASRVSSSGDTPILTCSQKNDKFTVNTSLGNGALTYPIGLLTMDEAIFAGGSSNAANYNYYLNGGKGFWTMTPHSYSASAGYLYTFGVYFTGSIGEDRSNSPFVGVSTAKPVISLKIDTLKSGEGTTTNPFIVWQYGDVNRDGILTEEDSQLILNYNAQLISFDDEQLILGDINKDGKVDLEDAVYVMQILDGLI